MAASVLDQVIIVGNVSLRKGDRADSAYAKGTDGKESRFNFSVAVTPRTKNQQTNAWEDDTTTWHNLTVWGSMADNVHDSLKGGEQVIVIGHNKTRSYKDRDGNDQTAVNVIVDYIGVTMRWGTVEFHRNGGSGNGGGNYHNNNSAPAAAPAPQQSAAAPAQSDSSSAFDEQSLDDLFN